MTSLSNHAHEKEPPAQMLSPVQRLIMVALIAVVVSVGLGFWAYRGSVVFTELVDLALAWCF